MAEIKLTYKSNVKPSLRPKICTSRGAFNILKQTWDESKIELVEQFKVMFTNRAQKILGIVEISTGGVSGTVADPKIIFAAAIRARASGFLLAHNHASGNLTAQATFFRGWYHLPPSPFLRLRKRLPLRLFWSVRQARPDLSYQVPLRLVRQTSGLIAAQFP